MFPRRLLIVLAVLIGLTALAAGVAPRPPATGDSPPAAAPPQGEAQEALEVALSADPGREVRVIEAELGQVVRLTVEGEELDSVAVGELRIEPIDPESPARFELLVDVAGSYPITLLDAERRIGVLEVSG